MSNLESTGTYRDFGERPTAIEPEASPFWPQNLIDLFLRPRTFFSGQLALGKTPFALLVTWCYGMANAIDRVGNELVKAELGSPRPGWEHMGPFVFDNWLGFWGWVLGTGAISGLFLWYVGGWWYRTRLTWSGATDPDARTARLCFVYSSFVCAGPAVLLALGQTVWFPSYAEAFAADEWVSLVFLVFPFWSLGTSYLGARTLFDVSPGKARLWFVILPGILYVAVFGVVAAAFALLGAA